MVQRQKIGRALGDFPLGGAELEEAAARDAGGERGGKEGSQDGWVTDD